MNIGSKQGSAAELWPRRLRRTGKNLKNGCLHHPSLPLALVILCLAFVPAVSAFSETAEADQHAQLGLQLAQAGKLKAAETEFRRALALEPENARYLADLGGVLGMEGNLRGAGAYFAKSLRIDPGNVAIRRDLAANEWQRGELDLAKDNLEQILRREPGDKPSILLLGMVQANLKNDAKAAELLGSVPELVRQHPQSLAALARCDYRTGEDAKARAVLANLAARFPDSQSIFLAGEMAEEAGDATTAEKLFNSIRATYPDQLRLTYHLAHADYLSGRWDECERRLLELINSGHGTGEVYDLLGLAYARQSHLTAAARAFEAAIALSPSVDSDYLDFAAALSAHLRRDQAIQVLTSCVSALQASFDCYEAKGRAESSQHYYKQSAASFRQALKLKPSSADAEFGFAAALAGLGNAQAAAAAYETAIRLDPRRAEFYRGYGRLLLADAGPKNNVLSRRAASLFERAIALDPSDAESHLLLGQLWLDDGEIQSAVPLLRVAARLDPQNGRPHYLLWRAYKALGLNSDAIAELSTFKTLSLRSHEPHDVGMAHSR